MKLNQDFFCSKNVCKELRRLMKKNLKKSGANKQCSSQSRKEMFYEAEQMTIKDKTVLIGWDKKKNL